MPDAQAQADAALLAAATAPQSMGERLADAVAARLGSWAFVGAQSAAIATWIGWNTVAPGWHFDPAPYIALNLLLSLQAAYTGPVLLISANRQSAADRAMLHALVGQHSAILSDIHAMTAELHAMHRDGAAPAVQAVILELARAELDRLANAIFDLGAEIHRHRWWPRRFRAGRLDEMGRRLSVLRQERAQLLAAIEAFQAAPSPDARPAAPRKSKPKAKRRA